MAWDPIIWVIFFLMNIALIALNIYQDLEADYLNPYESSSSRINAVVIPEMVLQAVFCGLFLVTGNWFMFIITLPNACYNGMFLVMTVVDHVIDEDDDVHDFGFGAVSIIF